MNVQTLRVTLVTYLAQPCR